MKNLIISSCVCLALIILPCSSYAEHQKAQRAADILTTSLLGAGAGILVGAAAAAISGSTSGTSLGVGAAIGFLLGFIVAVADPGSEGTPQGSVQQDSNPQ